MLRKPCFLQGCLKILDVKKCNFRGHLGPRGGGRKRSRVRVVTILEIVGATLQDGSKVPRLGGFEYKSHTPIRTHTLNGQVVVFVGFISLLASKAKSTISDSDLLSSLGNLNQAQTARRR